VGPGGWRDNGIGILQRPGNVFCHLIGPDAAWKMGYGQLLLEVQSPALILIMLCSVLPMHTAICSRGCNNPQVPPFSK